MPPMTPPRPPTPPERRHAYHQPRPSQAQQQQQLDGSTHQPTATPHDAPATPAVQAGQPRDLPRQPPRLPSDMSDRRAPSPGSESETSWPSEDNEGGDNNVLMQTSGRASSSTDPAPGTGEESSTTLLNGLDNILQTLLQQSFLQPREDVTDLAYRACSRLLSLRRALTRELGEPCPVNTIPDGTNLMLDNPLAEAQVALRRTRDEERVTTVCARPSIPTTIPRYRRYLG